jgi:hypothetical protein
VTDFLDDKRQEIIARLKELKPLVDEFGRLEAAAIALAGVSGSASSGPSTSVAPVAPAAPRRRGPGRRPRGSVNPASARPATPKASKAPKAAKKAGRRAGRSKGSGKRVAESLSFVQGQPGITIPELAAKMGIKQNYLYRVLPRLEQEKKIEKKGRGWHPTLP